MAISVTNIGTNTNSSGATIAVTVGAGGVPSGSLICAAVDDNSNSAPAGSVTDSVPNSYSPATGANNNATNARGFGRLFYAWNAAALVQNNTITYTKAVSGAAGAISAFYATSIQTSSDPLDSAATNTATGSSTSPSVTSGTPSASGDLFVGVATHSGLSTGFTQDSTNAAWAVPPNGATVSNASCAGGNVVNSGAGTLKYNPTLGSARDWAALIVAFKAAAAAAGPPQRTLTGMGR